MGINKDRTYHDSTALRPKLVLERPARTPREVPTRTRTWGAGRQGKEARQSLKAPKHSEFREEYKEKKDNTLLRSIGRGIVYLTGITVIVGGSFVGVYAVTKMAEGEGVDVNADKPTGDTTNIYQPVSAGANSNLIPPISIAPAAIEPQAEPLLPAATVPAPAPILGSTTLTPLVNVELPNPLQFSPAAGNVVCSGEVVTVQITADTRQFVALANATGEPWNAGVEPHNDDETLFMEVLAVNGYTNGVPPPPYSLSVRNGCVGLEL